MTYGMTLDPVRAADQYEEALSQAAADCREHEAKVKAARDTLAEIYGKALKGPADFPVPTPGSGRKTRAVFELIGDLEDDQLSEVFEILRDAAEGQAIQPRAIVFMAGIAERNADWYAAVKVAGEEVL